LGATEVHIWHARLDLPAPDLQALEQTLAADDPQPASASQTARAAPQWAGSDGARAVAGPVA
jgi:hypothetical protein